jgi:aconitase B
MSSILTDLSNEVVGTPSETSLQDEQVLEMYLEHLKSLMIQMIDNGFLHVEK